MKKKISSILILALMAIMVLSGCGSGSSNSSTSQETTEKIKIGYANLADTDVFCKMRKENFAANADPNWEIIYTDANEDINQQLNQIDNFITQKVDIMVIVPVDYDGIVPGIEKANEANIPVICLGIAAASGDYTYVGSKNIDAGRMQGEFMEKKLSADAEILYLEGTPGLYHSKERLEGFKEVCTKEILANLPGDYVREKAMKITEDWIQTFPHFDAIVAANDQMALGAIEALKGANRLSGVLVSGIDGVPEALQAIKNGEMAHTVYQDAPNQAKKCCEIVRLILSGEKPPKEAIVPFISVTEDNVDEFLNK